MKTKFLLAVKNGLINGLSTALLLFRIVLPVFVIVAFIGYTDVYLLIASKLEPAMRIFGLPGEAGVSLIVGAFSDEYAVVAAMKPFSFSQAQITVIAMFTLYFHSIPVETIISKKIGIPPLKIALFRFVMAVLTGIVVSYLASVFLGGTPPSFLPQPAGETGAGSGFSGSFGFNTGFSELFPKLGLGVLNMAFTLLRVLIPMMIVIELMFAYNIVEILARKLSPVCRLFRISKDALIPLLVGFLLGITYGVGAIMELNRKKPLSARDLWMLGVFLFSCHGIIETTYLFAVAGGSAIFVSGVRLLIAIAVTALMARLPIGMNEGNEKRGKLANRQQ